MIRRTWLEDTSDEARCAVFLVGTAEEEDSENSSEVRTMLELENAIHGDMLLAEMQVVDSYHRLVRA